MKTLYATITSPFAAHFPDRYMRETSDDDADPAGHAKRLRPVQN